MPLSAEYAIGSFFMNLSAPGFRRLIPDTFKKTVLDQKHMGLFYPCLPKK